MIYLFMYILFLALSLYFLFSGNIYWTNQGADVIELSRLDGSHRYVILHSDMDKPRAIAVHPQEG